jgi:hypothetical protein
MYELGELVLSEFALHLSVVGAGAEGEARHFQAGVAKRNQVCSFAGFSQQRYRSNSRNRTSGETCLEKMPPGNELHDLTPEVWPRGGQLAEDYHISQ